MKKYKYETTFTFNGKRYHVRADSKKELYKKEALKKRDLEENKVIINGSMTVREWTMIALDRYKVNVSYEGLKIETYQIEKNILKKIGSLKISSIKPIQCQEVLNAQAGMSNSQIKKIQQYLQFIFRTAKENHLILESPAEHLVRPKGYTNKRRSITEEERKHLLKVFESDPHYILFELMLYCGCRPEEAIRAEGRDIYEENGIYKFHIRGTKTVNSDRVVPMPKALYNRLKDIEPGSPLAPNKYGRRHSESSYDRLVAHLKRDLNISMGAKVYRNQLVPPLPLAKDFVPYDLRHTYCTDLQKKGIDVRTTQKLMGHSSIEITANIYTHVDESQIEDAGRILGASD